jgi:hypothetical protein
MLAIGSLLTIIGTKVIAVLFGISTTASAVSSGIASIVFLVVARGVVSQFERNSTRAAVKKWNNWKCPSCGVNYALKKGDAFRWVRRVYTAPGSHVRHTNELGVRLRCRACEKWANFLEDGRDDPFEPDPKAIMVGGNESEVNIED